MVYANGCVFDGMWTSDNRSEGRQTWPDGRTYVGQWKGDHRHGQGKQTHPDGRVYTGDWKDDQMHGSGKYITSDGTVYEGEFINNDYRMSLHI